MSPRTQRSRGPDPEDAVAFAASQLERVRAAVAELSWLLSRHYAPASALALVGDRHQLTQRQRLAVGHCACADEPLVARCARRLASDDLAGRALRIDGFNCIITVEAALSGALLLVGRDGVWRDLSRVRGSYHPVAVTERAVALIGETLARAGVATIEWFLDRPVSNSGRLRELLLDTAAARGWPWRAELSDGTDRAVAAAPDVVASSDSWILDRGLPWLDLPAAVLLTHHIEVWLVAVALDAG